MINWQTKGNTWHKRSSLSHITDCGSTSPAAVQINGARAPPVSPRRTTEVQLSLSPAFIACWDRSDLLLVVSRCTASEPLRTERADCWAFADFTGVVVGQSKVSKEEGSSQIMHQETHGGIHTLWMKPAAEADLSLCFTLPQGPCSSVSMHRASHSANASDEKCRSLNSLWLFWITQ